MKKKYFSLLLLLGLLSTQSSFAYDVKDGDIYYNLYDSYAAVTYKSVFPQENTDCYVGTVVVPNYITINGRVYPVREIENWAFSNCAKLQSIIINGYKLKIGNYAFSGCTGLSSVMMSSDVVEMGDGVFRGCVNLTEITIPENVERMGYNPFIYCSHLKNIIVNKNSKNFYSEDGMLCKKHTKELVSYPLGKGGNCIVPSSCEGIGPFAFYSSSVVSVNLPSSISVIGRNAFYNCASITQINIPSSVTDIRENAFYGCKELKMSLALSKIKNIGKSSFAYCKNLYSISIGSRNCEIGDSAFAQCSNLQELNLKEGIIKIGNYCFADCGKIQSLVLPKSLLSLGLFAFKNDTIEEYMCDRFIGRTKQERGTLAYMGASFGTVKYQGNDLYEGMILGSDLDIGTYKYGNISYSLDFSIQKLELTGSPTEIPSRAFCGPLHEVVLPSSITIIGGEAFKNCSGLTSIEIPEGVTEIGAYAFANTSLKIVELPNSLEKIGDFAFENDGTLEKVYFGKSIRTLGNGIFSGCTKLNSVYFQSKLPRENNVFANLYRYQDVYVYIPLDFDNNIKTWDGMPVSLYQDIANWDEEYYHLYVWMNTGEKIEFVLEEEPVMTYVNENIVFETAERRIELPSKNVWRIAFTDSEIPTIDNNGITVTSVVMLKAVPAIKSQYNEITITGLSKGEKVNIYSVDGRKVKESLADSQGNLNITITDLPQGVYVIKANQLIYKVVRR